MITMDSILPHSQVPKV
uniref:Uncharacterized protein n=1 Tax=Rhizophora mucronata TaxID=61149 RepID=A0A2P2J2M8_RHIMU